MSMIDESLKQFFWAATLWRRKRDQLSYESLMQMKQDGALSPKIRNRIAEIEFQNEKQNPTGDLRGPSVA